MKSFGKMNLCFMPSGKFSLNFATKLGFQSIKLLLSIKILNSRRISLFFQRNQSSMLDDLKICNRNMVLLLSVFALPSMIMVS